MTILGKPLIAKLLLTKPYALRIVSADGFGRVVNSRTQTKYLGKYRP
jgi:hypothetical protein